MEVTREVGEEAGEMAQHLRTSAALGEDVGFRHPDENSQLYLQSQGIRRPLFGLQRTAQAWYIDTQAGKIPIYRLLVCLNAGVLESCCQQATGGGGTKHNRRISGPA